MLLIPYMLNSEALKCSISSKWTHRLIFSRPLYRCGSTSQTCTRTCEMDTTSSLCWRCCLESRWWENTNGVTAPTQACTHKPVSNWSITLLPLLDPAVTQDVDAAEYMPLSSVLERMISWISGHGYLCWPFTRLPNPLPLNVLTFRHDSTDSESPHAQCCNG